MTGKRSAKRRAAGIPKKRGAGRRTPATNLPELNDSLLYTIQEVSVRTGIPEYTLRDWEKRFPAVLRPARSRTGRRVYTADNIRAIESIRQHFWDEQLTSAGASVKVLEKLHGVPSPHDRKAVLDLLDQLAQEVRRAIDILDQARYGTDTSS